MDVLVVDAANVVGSRPDGWWRNRAGAAARLRDRLAAAGPGELPPRPDAVRIWLVLEGVGRAGAPVGTVDGVRTVHAEWDGDAAIVAETRRARDEGHRVLVVTADRELRERVIGIGALVVGPGWLLDRV